MLCPAAEEIIECLVQNFSGKNETRTPEERYEIIMQLVFGEDTNQEDTSSDNKKGSGPGRPSYDFSDKNYNKKDVFLLMAQSRNNGFTKDNTDAARTYYKFLPYSGTPGNAIKKLAADFSKEQEQWLNREFQEQYIKTGSKEPYEYEEDLFLKPILSDESADIQACKTEIINTLKNNNWPL